ncbi:DUF4142 domain-containing protein [Terriglobus albidus]|uniref:DUF4142 domain-containing protein n=1 Tax=Terriglobus albidus TaxID=1592106 RepID=UPI0021DF5D58|nr:DUF4142 domain-containing protein [Terriglobus albidus]
MSTLLASTIAIGQNQPGASGQQQPNMPNQQPMNSGGMGPDANSMNQQATTDKDFVKKALEGGTAEVELGQLAQQKSQSEDVRQFGQKMVDDHTQLGDQIKPIAQQMGVKEPKEPSKKDKQLIARLGALSGSQFDEAYIQAMVKDHKQDLKEFKDEAQLTQDPNVKQVARQGTGVISQHLRLIEQIAQNHNVAVDGKSKASSSAK